MDVGAVISTGTLEGPYISWHKKAVIKALDEKLVTGKGFTFAIFNGFTLGAALNIGDYEDPTFAFEVDGFSIGWDGFRGTLSIDENSFKLIKNK